MSARRGEVWWVSIPGLGERPTVIVSAEMLNRALSEVTVARVTAVERERALPTYVALDAGEIEELPERSFILCHNLHTLPKSALRRRAGSLGPSRMVELEDALRVALDLEAA